MQINNYYNRTFNKNQDIETRSFKRVLLFILLLAGIVGVISLAKKFGVLPELMTLIISGAISKLLN